MDPNANLAELVKLSKAVQNGTVTGEEAGERIAELVMALHGWIVRGGALPDAWTKKS